LRLPARLHGESSFVRRRTPPGSRADGQGWHEACLEAIHDETCEHLRSAAAILMDRQVCQLRFKPCTLITHPIAWLDSLVLRSSQGDGYALTRWFALTSALAIAAFSILMGSLIGGFISSRMIQRDAEVGREFAQSMANVQQVAGYFDEPGQTPPASVAEFFAHVAAMPDVIRANVYSPSRRVLWSSRPELIGAIFPANHELDRALAGDVVAHRAGSDHGPDKAEHQGLGVRPDEYVENYLPLFDPHSARARLIGVIEVYRRPSALLATIREGKQRVWLASAGGGLLLFTLLVWFVYRTEHALQAQRARLVDAETMAIVGEISAAVAHSIRNPLGSIRTSAELQRELHGEGSDIAAVGSDIMRQVDRIEHLVRNLLSYVGNPTEHQGSADLASLLCEAGRRFKPDLEAQGKRLDIDLGERLGRVGADPVMLAQVFDSLLANAVEATREGDRVTLQALRVGSVCEVFVRDTGEGIAPEHLALVFKPFSTSKPRGLGMGLTLAQRIVHKLGGRIAVRSAISEGTEVSVKLPVVDP
jgi:signal transduction histidine kinase